MGRDRSRPSPALRRRIALDVLAWLLFAAGVIAMFVVVFLAALGEGDGAVRSWETIRWQVRMLLAAAVVGVIGPLALWILQRWLDRRDRSKKADNHSHPLE